MKATRRPLGNAVSREQLSIAWIDPGRRFVQSYVTSFANQQSMRETVFCALQPDGRWKVEKYQLEPSSERSRPVRASDRQIFAAIAVAAMLLLTASGNATVMLIGSAVLLVVGLVWLPRSRWRIALLVALASMGVAGFTVLFLNRIRPATADNSAPPNTETTQTNATVLAPELTVALDGSSTHDSIQAALDDALEGTVIRIGPGRYEDPLLITKSVSLIGAGWNETVIGPATPVAPPTAPQMAEMDRQFRAASTDEERNRLRSEARDRFFRPVVQVRNAAKVSFEGIKFTLPGTPPEGTLLDSTVIEIGEAHARFDACAIVGSPGNGIVLSDGANVIIRNALIAAAWNTGIRVERGTKAQLTVMDSDIRNCHYAGVVIGRGQNDVTIERCRVSGAAWHGIRYDHASPTITGNLIFANARSGIYASGVTAAQVQANVFWKNEMNGMSCWFENRDGITNNTFAANRREGLSVLGASSPASSETFSGNIRRAFSRATSATIRRPRNRPPHCGFRTICSGLMRSTSLRHSTSHLATRMGPLPSRWTRFRAISRQTPVSRMRPMVTFRCYSMVPRQHRATAPSPHCSPSVPGHCSRKNRPSFRKGTRGIRGNGNERFEPDELDRHFIADFIAKTSSE